VPKTKEQVFAVLRVDREIETPEDSISVVKIVVELEEAIKEVERLNSLNAGKGARYFWQATRYYPTTGSQST
jgi:hypothetical protein